jgi:hypothetical protein
VVAHRGRQHVDPVHRARQGLDQRRVHGAHTVGQHNAVRHRRRHVLRGAAGRRDPDAAPPVTQVPPPAAAEVALAAVEGRVDGHLVADAHPVRGRVDRRADRDHLTGELVSRRDRERRGELAVGDVEVGAADAARGHVDHDLARSGCRIG